MLSFANLKHVEASYMVELSNERQQLLRREHEDFLATEVAAVAERVKDQWRYDYSTIPAFLASVEQNRQEWRKAVGVWPEELDPLQPQIYPYYEDEEVIANWIILPFKGTLRCHGALALPKKRAGRLPIVIAQHGVGSTPEQIFGLRDHDGHYHSFGHHLLRTGYAVLTPVNVLLGPPRSRLQRLCLLLGITMQGLEIRRYQRWIDYLETVPEVDADRIGMWGLSLGGFAVLVTMPVEQRIKVGINAAFFNHRVTKMAFEDPRYTSFLPTKDQGEHAYIPGWLSKFRDSELLSLTCPRPYQIQAGKADSISWYPLVEEEFERSKMHYEKLGIGDRIELLLHEGGHEVKVTEGIKFLDKWL